MGDWFDKTWPLYPQPFEGIQAPTRRHSASMYGWDVVCTPVEIINRVYPVRWFMQMQAYVRALLANKPAANAPVEEQVYWSLMLMSSVSNGLWAGNAIDMVWGASAWGYLDPVMMSAVVGSGHSGNVWGGNANRADSVTTVDGTTYANRAFPLSGWSNSPDLDKLLELRMAGRCHLDAHSGFGKHVPSPDEYQGVVSGASLVGAMTANWPKAPFFGMPLFNDHISNVWTFQTNPGSEAHPHNNTTGAGWWDAHIATPTAKHCPWAQDGWSLMYPHTTPPGVIEREGPSYFDSPGWQSSKFVVDARANDWIVSQMAADKPWKREALLKMWNFMAFGCRYPVPNAGFYIQTLDDIVYDAKVSRGQVAPRFPVSWVVGSGAGSTRYEVDWANTFDFAKAYDGGYYDDWGKWFADIQYDSLILGLTGVYTDITATGYLRQWYEGPVGDRVIHAAWFPKSLWDDADGARKWARAGEILGPIMLAVQFIVSVWTVNVGGILSSMVSLVEMLGENAKQRDIPPWEWVKKMFNGHLRSLPIAEGPGGWVCNFDNTNGDMEAVYNRMMGSLENAITAVVEQMPSPALDAQPAEGSSKPAPSSGGPTVKVRKPPPPVFAPDPSVFNEKNRDRLLWAAAIVAAGFAMWSVTPSAQKGAVRKQTRKLTTKAKSSKAYRRAAKTAKPVTQKVRTAAKRAKAGAQSTYRKVRSSV
jgi:hypothetical protein